MHATDKKLARHALGFDQGVKQSYRNRFLAGYSCPSLDAWSDMVLRGDAVAGKKTDIGQWFSLTLQGAHAALNKGESLSREDFPES